jgi:hypothetical protein
VTEDAALVASDAAMKVHYLLGRYVGPRVRYMLERIMGGEPRRACHHLAGSPSIGAGARSLTVRPALPLFQGPALSLATHRG